MAARETTEFGPEPLAASDCLTVVITGMQTLSACVSFSPILWMIHDLYTVWHYTEAALQSEKCFEQLYYIVLFANLELMCCMQTQ